MQLFNEVLVICGTMAAHMRWLCRRLVFAQQCALFVKYRLPSSDLLGRNLACNSSYSTIKGNVQTEKQTKNAVVGIPQDSVSVVSGSTDKAEKISKAMKAYLEHAQAHDAFMSEQKDEYEVGKQHLASIMGVNPDTFSQEEIDKAIEYLLPSGLFDKAARPMLKHPDEVIPKRKAAQFGADGRPFHCFFYTGKPNYVQAMHDLSLKIEELKRYDDTLLAKGGKANQNHFLQLAGSQWADKVTVEQLLQEQISDGEYQGFIGILDHIAKLPYSVQEKEIVFKYRKMLQKQSTEDDILPLKEDETGRLYQEGTGFRKEATANIKVWATGTGKMIVNGRTLLEHFPRIIDREQTIFPLHLTGKLLLVDFEATVEGGGPSGQAGALRLAIATALKSIVDKTMVEKMRLAGLLTRDPRIVERQKPGQQGARRKYTWLDPERPNLEKKR